MRILIACEFSGVVREAFKARGHDAWSCDLLPTEIPGQHLQMDVRSALDRKLWDVWFKGWDMMIAFPPCTHLASSGARWFKGKELQQGMALYFIRMLLEQSIEKIALENPVGIISTRIRKPDQIIQPWMFGHRESKRTCLWLKGLPLMATHLVAPVLKKNPDGTDYRDKKGKRYSNTHYYTGRMQKRYLNQTPSGQNNVGEQKDRWKIRSRTYKGVAEAMASQWNFD